MCGMVDISATHIQHRKETNHKETSCGMDCTEHYFFVTL